jgi:hypothetical protein
MEDGDDELDGLCPETEVGASLTAPALDGGAVIEVASSGVTAPSRFTAGAGNVEGVSRISENGMG